MAKMTSAEAMVKVANAINHNTEQVTQIVAQLANITTKPKDGKDGATPYIGRNGNWWIGGKDSGQSAAIVSSDIKQFNFKVKPTLTAEQQALIDAGTHEEKESNIEATLDLEGFVGVGFVQVERAQPYFEALNRTLKLSVKPNGYTDIKVWTLTPAQVKQGTFSAPKAIEEANVWELDLSKIEAVATADLYGFQIRIPLVDSAGRQLAALKHVRTGEKREMEKPFEGDFTYTNKAGDFSYSRSARAKEFSFNGYSALQKAKAAGKTVGDQIEVIFKATYRGRELTKSLWVRLINTDPELEAEAFDEN